MPSRVAPVFLLYACHRHYPGGIPGCTHRSLPQRRRPSPTYRRVGFHIPLFEACSTFTHVMACIFVKPPKVALCTGVLSSRLPPWAAAPITTGWSDFCRAGFAPAGRPCLCTAHGTWQGYLESQPTDTPLSPCRCSTRPRAAGIEGPRYVANDCHQYAVATRTTPLAIGPMRVVIQSLVRRKRRLGAPR